MTKFLRTALPLLAAISATGVASQASALNVTNCTGIGIRVHVYDNADMVQAFARAGSYIDASQTVFYDVGSGQMQLKIFQAGLLDQMRLSVSHVPGDGNTSVNIASDGRWSLDNGQHC